MHYIEREKKARELIQHFFHLKWVRTHRLNALHAVLKRKIYTQAFRFFKTDLKISLKFLPIIIRGFSMGCPFTRVDRNNSCSQSFTKFNRPESFFNGSLMDKIIIRRWIQIHYRGMQGTTLRHDGNCFFQSANASLIISAHPEKRRL